MEHPACEETQRVRRAAGDEEEEEAGEEEREQQEDGMRTASTILPRAAPRVSRKSSFRVPSALRRTPTSSIPASSSEGKGLTFARKAEEKPPGVSGPGASLHEGGQEGEGERPFSLSAPSSSAAVATLAPPPQ